ncbi:MAG: 3-oxoacyl-ACP reductase FabG [Melioribacteraceae bacterium]|nr:3-oxoacyl-ACP reductase FabG [Melioribacteraceae bacterium]MCF8265311.1 3-oxoacyl-ACP reductase FabG [Melioribacteraceae bacterium]MCF8412763.1 3-oxoacyl-ACP reductase FabG [Melioribacteraceae bacterium]
MIDITNKVVLITGGSRGIGAACVKLFSKAGADVAFTFKSNVEAAELLMKEIKPGSKVKYYRVNLQNEADITKKVERIVNDFGRIDILVNNAGIWNDGQLDKMTYEHWRETLQINLDGTFLISKAVVPFMKKKTFGRIINVSSTAAQRGESKHSHYAASKGAINSFTKSLAVELADDNITVNAVAPGWVDTDMCTAVFKDISYRAKIESDIPVGRVATADDIAGPILFLASDLARHINGEILNVNGGSVLCG